MKASQMGFLFAESDKTLGVELCKHLAGMRRSGLIELVGAPTGDTRITQQDLSSLDVLLLLVSNEFIASDFLVEMALYAERTLKDVLIIPIVLRDVNWERDLPKIGAKQGLPRNKKSVMRQDRDTAFMQIAEEIRNAL